jgi:hypothetical protein
MCNEHFSCKDDEETNITNSSIVGTWEMDKMNLKVYIAGVKFMDTTMNKEAGTSSIAIIKEDKSIMVIDNDGSTTDTMSGTYTITGTTLVLNLVDSKNVPTTEEYGNLTYNSTDLSFTRFDPDKTDLNRSEYTAQFKRK